MEDEQQGIKGDSMIAICHLLGFRLDSSKEIKITEECVVLTKSLKPKAFGIM